jgi:hypothetical protein
LLSDARLAISSIEAPSYPFSRNTSTDALTISSVLTSFGFFFVIISTFRPSVCKYKPFLVKVKRLILITLTTFHGENAGLFATPLPFPVYLDHGPIEIIVFLLQEALFFEKFMLILGK